MPKHKRHDLRQQARIFANELSTLLNGTVTVGKRLNTWDKPGGNAVIGYRLSKRKLLGEPIPLSTSRSPARFHLSVLNTVSIDETGQWLMTTRSNYTLQGDTPDISFFTYDYVRDPPNHFPEAHLHIHGKCDRLQKLLDDGNRSKNRPSDLHFPVGGRRFRPCLEDIIEFCILERLVKPHDNWLQVSTNSRNQYYMLQSEAARYLSD